MGEGGWRSTHVILTYGHAALAHLCEFIEDCEFTKLSVRILHLLGIEGPKTKQPTKFIRYIYNRVVLENAVVRAAAVSSLAKFGVCVGDPAVTKSVNVLLRRWVAWRGVALVCSSSFCLAYALTDAWTT